MTDKQYLENLSSIEEIIEEARNGRMFILVDDPNRENEGDLIIPAQFYGKIWQRFDMFGFIKAKNYSIRITFNESFKSKK